MTQATVRIAPADYQSGEDRLAYSGTVLTDSWDGTNGILTLSGSGTLAAYQAALRTVTYENLETVNPHAGSRNISFMVTDDAGNTSNTPGRVVSVLNPLAGPAPLPYTEDFETDGEGERYEANEYVSGSTDDRFDRSVGKPSTFQGTLANIEGSALWAGEDTDALPPGNEGLITLRPLTITDLTNLQLTLAVGNARHGEARMELGDALIVEAKVDNGSFTTILAFHCSTDSHDGELKHDADLDGNSHDGSGDGDVVTTNLADFVASIPGAGDTLTVRLRLLCGGNEEIAFDHIRVTGTPLANNPPVADAGDTISVNDADGNGSEAVALDGSGSSDGDGTITSWVWTDEGGTEIASGETASATLAVGSHIITLTVTDDDGDHAADTVNVTVTPFSGGSDTRSITITATQGGLEWSISPGDGTVREEGAHTIFEDLEINTTYVLTPTSPLEMTN